MDRNIERKILLRRLFYSDREFYRLGKLAGIPWFDRFEAKFERDRYAYFADEEKREAIEKIIADVSDDKFIQIVNDVFRQEKRYTDIPRFVGEHYYFDTDKGLELGNRQDEVIEDVLNALKETKGRGYYFIKAVIQLYKEGKWDGAFGGAAWVDILTKIRQLKGVYPPPRDLVLLKSYNIYFRTGSRRYPTHTIPEEMILVVEEALDRYVKSESGIH